MHVAFHEAQRTVNGRGPDFSSRHKDSQAMGKDRETLLRCSSLGYMDFFIQSSIREAHFGLSDSHRRILGRSNSLQPYKEQVRSKRYIWSVRGLDLFEERCREREKQVCGLDWCEEYAREREERLEITVKGVSLKELEKEDSRPIALFGPAFLLNDDQINAFICGDEKEFQPSLLKIKTMKHRATSASTREGRNCKIVRTSEESSANIGSQLSEAVGGVLKR